MSREKQKVPKDAKRAIQSLLSIMAIERVIFVDDAFEEDSPEDLTGVMIGLSNERIRELIPEFQDDLSPDPDVRGDILSKTVKALSKSRRHEILTSFTTEENRGNVKVSEDSCDGDHLQELLGSDILTSLSFSEWTARSSELLAESKQKKILFLFDQDLSNGDGRKDEGIYIIKALLPPPDKHQYCCGLLTYTVHKCDQEDRWKKLSDDYGVPKDFFVVVAKSWLRDDPLGFSRMLKIVALSPVFGELKAKAAEILDRASNAAIKQIEDVTVSDFDHIVTDVPFKEGEWEPDMVFRLFSLFHRIETRKLCHETDELEKIAQKIRVVRDIQELERETPSLAAWKMQKEETFDSGEHINRFHFPVELGDIFEKTSGSGRQFILIGQPCDLMIRSDGKRSNEPEFVMMAEIVNKNRVTPTAYDWEIPNFGANPEETFIVRLKKIEYIQPCVLDLCSFSGNGESKIVIDDSEISGLRPSMSNLRNRLVKKYRTILSKHLIVAPVNGETTEVSKVKKTIRKSLIPDVLKAGPFKATLSKEGETGVISFDCKRVMRLNMKRAMALLMAFASVFSRHGFEAPFYEVTTEQEIAE